VIDINGAAARLITPDDLVIIIGCAGNAASSDETSIGLGSSPVAAAGRRRVRGPPKEKSLLSRTNHHPFPQWAWWPFQVTGRPYRR
jgi:hypothetical protein